MKILFSHGGVIKLFQIQKGNIKNYENMRKFVQSNLPKVPPNFIVKYKDEDGDNVVIENNKDIECLFDTKSTDYVRASIQDVDARDQDSDVSDEDSERIENSKLEESGRNEDSRLKSDDEAQREPTQERQFIARNSILNKSLLDPKPQQLPQISKMSITQVQAQLIKQFQSLREPLNPTDKPSSQPFGCYYTRTTSQELPESNPVAQSREERVREEPMRNQRKASDSKQSIQREVPKPKSQPMQQPNPEQRQQKQQSVGSSMLRSSKISHPSNDKNVSRLVRTLFNEEFEQRLQAMIPRLMQKIKKQIRVTYPSLLSEPQLDQASEPAQQQPQERQQEQKVIHPNPCTGCTKQVIEGVRYKCLQCQQNYCEDCEKVLKHPHNMLKMRFLQVKQQKPQPIIDHKIEFVNKCFYLVSYFGGDGRDYTSFVEKYIDLGEKELLEEYLKKNSKKLKKRMGGRLIEMTKKLGLYFGQDYLEYNDLVLRNPFETFEGLVAYVKECGAGSEDQQGEDQSFSDLSTSVKSSARQFSRQSPYKDLSSRTTHKPSARSAQQQEQFLYFVCKRYQISAQKQPVKIKFIKEYYNRNQSSLSLQEMKGKFCEEVQKSDGEEWRAVGHYKSVKGTV